MNSSQVTHFTLGAYFEHAPFKWIYFILILCVYVLILLCNLLLIILICTNRTLHEPMYIILCSLLVNEVWGSTGLLPFLMVQMLQDVHIVSYAFCFIQIFCMYVYATVEIFTLSAMSYDRYLAICHPLQYNSRMTKRKVAALITVPWLYPMFSILTVQMLALSLELCGNAIPTVYCNNFYIVKLACGPTIVNNIFGLMNVMVTVCGPLFLILFSYLQILRVCFNGSKQARQKAVSTCTPHIASIINLSCGMFFEIVHSRFSMKGVPKLLRIFLSLYYLTIQPLLNPLLYGLKLTKVRALCRKMLRPRNWHW